MNENIAILGGQHGDESKARVCHWMAKDFNWVLRYSSSGNCGHTLYQDGKKIVRHLVPSANFNINKTFLGSGMVIILEDLLKEVQETEEMFPGAANKITVDPDAFVVLPQHVQEDKEKNKHIGSTNKGVSPAYRDKINRCGVKIRKLIDDNAEIIQALKKIGVQFKYSLELMDEFEKSKLIFEAGQSVMLDYNFASYPYCTSGECTLGGIFNAGFAKVMPTKVYGIIKPYTTKVGEGPFPTQYSGEVAERLQKLGQEIGATTNRLRKVGALDLVAVKYSVIKGGINSLVISKLDVLNGDKTVKVCSSYNKPVYSGNDFFNAQPNYIELPGWNNGKNIEQIRPFTSYVEEFVGVPVEYISSGVNEDDMFAL